MSSRRGQRELVGLVSGGLFALGLWLSGMADPGKVLGFLDVTGDWDPTLAFVMAGAVGVHFSWLRLRDGRAVPAADGATSLPPRSVIDARLLSGAALFGVGWGMSGYCPGPALVAAAFGRSEALWFGAAMLGGMALYGLLQRRAHAPVSVRDSV